MKIDALIVLEQSDFPANQTDITPRGLLEETLKITGSNDYDGVILDFTNVTTVSSGSFLYFCGRLVASNSSLSQIGETRHIVFKGMNEATEGIAHEVFFHQGRPVMVTKGSILYLIGKKLTEAQQKTFETIVRHPNGITQSALAIALGINQNTVSTRLSLLHHLGLTKREVLSNGKRGRKTFKYFPYLPTLADRWWFEGE